MIISVQSCGERERWELTGVVTGFEEIIVSDYQRRNVCIASLLIVSDE